MRLVFSLSLLLFCSEVSAQSKSACASELIEKIYSAMGGRWKFDETNNIQFKGYGYRNLVEQSERFQGPFIPDNFTFRTILDRQNQLLSMSSKRELFEAEFKFLVDKETVAAINARGQAIPWQQDQTIQDELDLGPLQILKTALSSGTAICIPDSIIHGVPNRRIQFRWKGFAVCMCINSYTHLLTSTEVWKPYNDYYLNVWGDLKKVTFYSFWDILENGLHCPMQKDVYFNGNLWESSLIKQAKINVPLSPDSIRIPQDIRAKSLDMENLNKTRVEEMFSAKREIAKDIWMIPGYCTATVIKQGEGLIIIEAPHSSDYTSNVIKVAEELFPGLRVNTMVTTSDAWLHCGGIRTAANTCRVMALAQNKEILEDILNANYFTHPDAWQQENRKRPGFQYITSRTVVGTGDNRIELIPFNTEAGERMMMVYFPEHKLLYASDLYQPGNWQKHYTIEVAQAVQRENLNVKWVYAMHSSPVKYDDILKLVSEWSEKKANQD